MKTIFWLSAVVLTGLLGYLLHSFIEHRKSQVEFIAYNVGQDQIALYQTRVDSLKAVAAALESRLDSQNALRWGSARAHMELLRDEIASLERTIEMWQMSRENPARLDIERQVILLYGKASAAARALAADTLLPGGR